MEYMNRKRLSSLQKYKYPRYPISIYSSFYHDQKKIYNNNYHRKKRVYMTKFEKRRRNNKITFESNVILNFSC